MAMSSQKTQVAPDEIAELLKTASMAQTSPGKSWDWRQSSEDNTGSKDSSSHSSINFAARSRDASGHSGPFFCSREGSLHGRSVEGSMHGRSCMAGSREGSMHGRNSREGSMHGRLNVSFCDASGIAPLTAAPTRLSPRYRSDGRSPGSSERDRRPSLERDTSAASSKPPPPQLRGLMSLGRGGPQQPSQLPHQVMGPPAPACWSSASLPSVSAPAMPAAVEPAKLPQLTYDPPSAPMMHLHSALSAVDSAAPAFEAPAMHPQSAMYMQPAPPAIYHSQPSAGSSPQQQAPAPPIQPQAPAYVFTSHDLWTRAMQRWQTPSSSDAP